MYNAILIGGLSFDRHGRPLGLFRLRTSVERSGYSVKVIDYASVFDSNQLLNLLSKLVTPATKVIGISGSWFHQNQSNTWATDDFFKALRKIFPEVKIVTGGTKITTIPVLYNNSDWFLTGFSDISFVHLLDHLLGKKVNLKYFQDSNGVRIIESDIHYKVEDMDSLETVYKKEDSFLPYQPLSIEISRGCIFKCAFCTHPFLGKKSYDYIRSPESISNELKRNYELFGTTRYFISDDTFNDSIEKLDRVRKAIELSKIPKFEFVSYIRPELLVTQPKMIHILNDLGLKGAFFGIESMNHHARKVIGKGTDIEKVLDAAEKLNSAGNVKIHANFILGLPGDNYDDFLGWQEFLKENQNSLFTSWAFKQLELSKKTIGDIGYSLIEKSPESYGYKIHEEPNSIFLDWTNDKGLTFKDMQNLSGILNNEANKVNKSAGWELGAAWFHDISNEDIRNKTVHEINLDQLSKTRSINRALQNYYFIVR